VLQLSSEGVPLHKYGSQPGDAIGQLNGPGHIALLPARGAERPHILVAEYHNARLALFDFRLNLLRVIIDMRRMDGVQLIERPRRICYFADRAVLLMGLAGQRGVDVYELADHPSRPTTETRCGVAECT
jgi:hypothetical protein